jgi:hypothetical protein
MWASTPIGIALDSMRGVSTAGHGAESGRRGMAVRDKRGAF